MISYKYKITNKSGKTIYFNDHITDPDNVIALQKYPSFSRLIKSQEIDRVGQNNYWDFFSYWGKQTLSFQGIIVAENNQKLEQMKADIQNTFALPIQPVGDFDGYVVISWTDVNGIDKQIEAKLVNDIQFDRELRQRELMTFIIQLKTKYNFVEDMGDYNEVIGSRGYFYNYGITLPTLLPAEAIPNIYGEIDINISGIGSYPIFEIKSEIDTVITNPKITNLTTGQMMRLNYTMSANETIIIDTLAGKITSNISGVETDITALLNDEDIFMSLVSGINSILYTDDNLEIDDLNATPEPNTFKIKYKNIYAN